MIFKALYWMGVKVLPDVHWYWLKWFDCPFLLYSKLISVQIWIHVCVWGAVFFFFSFNFIIMSLFLFFCSWRRRILQDCTTKSIFTANQQWPGPTIHIRKRSPFCFWLQSAICMCSVYVGKTVNFKYKYEFQRLLCMCGRLKNKNYYYVLQMYVYIYIIQLHLCLDFGFV